MFTLFLTALPKALEGVHRHTCAVGGVYPSIGQSPRVFANNEVEMR